MCQIMPRPRFVLGLSLVVAGLFFAPASATPWPVTNGDQFYIRSITVNYKDTPYTFDFGNLKWVNNTSQGFLPDGTKGVDWFNGTGGDVVSSNMDSRAALGGTLKYTVNGLQVTASAFSQAGPDQPRLAATVVQDHDNNYPRSAAGLGTYTKYGNNGDDNIQSGELLSLTFSDTVHLDSFTLSYEGHNDHFHPGTSVMFQVDDKAPYLVDLQPTLVNPSIGSPYADGKEFTFIYTVPEPASAALVLTGVGAAVAAFGRRRSRA